MKEDASKRAGMEENVEESVEQGFGLERRGAKLVGWVCERARESCFLDLISSSDNMNVVN